MSVRWLLAPGPAAAPAWWRSFLAGGLLCVAAPAIRLAPGVPGDDYVWTTGYGVAATALLVVALVYGVRRRMPRRGPGALRQWVQAHVYGGTLFLVLMAVHAGPSLPDGALAWGLWVSGLWVVATGLLGVFIQKWIPSALTSALTTEVHHDRIPELVAAVREEMDLLAAAGGESVRTFHETNLRPALAGPRASAAYLFDITGGIQSRMRRFDHVKRLLDGDDIGRLERLRVLMRTKLEMDAHYTLQKVLRWWLHLHVPAACLLTVLVAIHVLAVAYY